mgnify:CR=1 FL=1
MVLDIIISKVLDGYSAAIPSINGCETWAPKEDEAIEVYKNAIGSFSREIALLGKMRIANIQAQRPFSKEYLDAIKIYDEIITRYPDSALVEESMLRKGLTLTLFSNYLKAIEALESFQQQYSNSVYVQRGVIQENIDENLKGLIDHYWVLNFLK